jgi:regulatory protein
MLARRPYSVAELRRALGRKYGDTAPVKQALTRLRQLGYLDDRKFAEQVASSLARNRAYGRQRIRRELKAKLVDYRHIEPALEETFQEIDERQLLEKTLDKKIRGLRRPVTAGKLASLCQSLMRRGFRSSDIINAVRCRPELQPATEDANLEELNSSDAEPLNR